MANNNPFIPGGAPAPSMPMPGQAPVNDSFEVDLTNVETGGFTIPDGNYRVKCMNVEQTVSKGGNPMFVWDFEIVDGPHTGFKSKVFTAITPSAMWKVAETVIALGVGQQGSVVKFKRSDVLNKECGALFETTEYNGQNRSQIARVMTLQELAEALK
jgi:hypothetical protein